jgi:sodium/proline symporter
VILAYAVKGGLQSSIPTQFVQALIMLFTTIGMFILAVYIGGGPIQIAADLNSLDPDLLSLDGGHGALFIILIILGFSSAAFAFDVGQPQLLVRIMATKSPEEAAKARWIYIGFMQITWISMTLFGVIMSVLLPDIADPEQALPIFARENLPPLLAGATMAGIFAAVASTLDGQLLVLSSSIGVDLSPRFYRRMIDRFGVRYQEWVTAIVTVILAVASIAMIGNSTVFTLIVFSATALGVSVGCAMFISLSGWKTSAAAMSTGLLAALMVAVVWRHMGFSALLLEALPAFLTGLLVHWVVIRMTYKLKPAGSIV